MQIETTDTYINIYFILGSVSLDCQYFEKQKHDYLENFLFGLIVLFFII